MHPEKKEQILKIVASARAKELLEFMNDHETVRYTDMDDVANPWTLNERVHDLYAHGFITYTGKSKRKLYKITEKGRKVLKCIHEIEELVPGKGKEILHLLGLKYVISVLEFISKHGQTKYADMENDFTIYSIRTKVGDLIRCGLVHLQIEKLEKRREWFEITEEGKKALQIVDNLVNAFEG